MNDGILLIDKPKGITSHDVINQIRRITKMKKIGHSGTLDPNATGLLVLFLGNATKLLNYVDDNHKAYIADIIFGQETTTDDITGETTKEVDTDFTEAVLVSVLDNFIGTYDQYPPIYSARKVNGKKLYEYARDNKDVVIKPKEITVNNIELLDTKDIPNSITIEVDCSKGTYIRSLARDIGRALKGAATMGDLRRTQSGYFDLKEAVKLEDLKEANDVFEHIIPIEKAFSEFNYIDLKDNYLIDLKNGKQLYEEAFNSNLNGLENEVVLIKNSNKVQAIGIVNKSKNEIIVRPKKVFIN